MTTKPIYLLLLSVLSSLSFTTAFTPKTTAQLPYGTFIGSYSSQYNITYYNKIPFAAPPTGVNRFRGPQPPLKITENGGLYNSSPSFDMCPQRTVNGSEDCLYLGLYSRPWAPGQKLRPVVVTFYGGGLIQGSASFSLPGTPPSGYPVLNASVDNNIIFVYPNYRVNVFGFLPGRQIVQDGESDTNVGFLDQRAVLRWVQSYVGEFGGDVGRVSIWGQSSGAASVLAQVLAQGGADQNEKRNAKRLNRRIGRERRGETENKGRNRGDSRLFQKALASSPFWPKTYGAESKEAQWIYDKVVNLTGCASTSSKRDTSLACLKSLDVQTLRNASLIIDASHTYTTSQFTWAAVIDGTFLKEPLSAATAGSNPQIDIDVGWGMYNEYEGESFLPPDLANAVVTDGSSYNSTAAGFDFWLRAVMPDFSDAMIAEVKTWYPDNGTAEEMVYQGTFLRAQIILRDVTLACPARWMAEATSTKGRGYIGEYGISPAKHASDVSWWNTVNANTNHPNLIYDGYAGAFASYFQTGDPNAHKLTNSSEASVPEIKSGQEWFIAADGFHAVDDSQMKGRCDFWRSVAKSIPL